MYVYVCMYMYCKVTDKKKAGLSWAWRLETGRAGPEDAMLTKQRSLQSGTCRSFLGCLPFRIFSCWLFIVSIVCDSKVYLLGLIQKSAKVCAHMNILVATTISAPVQFPSRYDYAHDAIIKTLAPTT